MVRLTLVIVLALLGGCSASPSKPSDPTLAWAAHAERLTTLDKWQLRGRLALKNNGEGWHASMAWQQSADEYDIQITGPLGQGSVRLQGNSEVVILDAGNDATTLDNNPESLLERQFGWQVPVASLRYWVTGLPAPGDEQHQLDEFGRLSQLEQRGWSIRFLDYQAQQLPRKLVATRGDATVRLIITEWLVTGPQEENP